MKTRKQKRAEKLIDQRTDYAFRKTCNGVQIDLMDIPKVFAEGRRLQAEGADGPTLCNGIYQFVMRLTKEPA